MKKTLEIFTRRGLMRLGMMIAATAIILLLLPRADHQSYIYELNQPWRYPLLTADMDMPIQRDSASARSMRDSIDRAFVPVVKIDNSIPATEVDRFVKAVQGHLPADDRNTFSRLLSEVYNRGVVSAGIYEHLRIDPEKRLRTATDENGSHAVRTISGASMLSPGKAYEYIDSAFLAAHPDRETKKEHGALIARALNAVLIPNVVLDTVIDSKFREQEYLTANAALGVIKKGQRIVDRGEIVTPQIYTNLNTYMEMLDQSNESDKRHSYFIVGQALYILICFTSLYIFLGIARPRFYTSTKKMSFLMSFLTIFVAFSVLMMQYIGNGMYLIPFASVPVLILVFFDSRTAIFSLIVAVMISALMAVYPFQFIFIQLAAGVAAAFSLNTLSQRSQLLRTAFIAFVTYCLTYVTMELIVQGDLSQFQWRVIGSFAINSVVLSFVYILVLVIEKLFGFTSTVTLVELSDINNPLLRRLAQEAPGTFQHSMQVSTLAAEAARAIDANTQLVRTGALYHDIGKLESPIFFTENQHGVNPHTGLNPETSAHKIISHVSAGLQIAQQSKLPGVIRDFIAEHHGRSLAKYFYNTAVNANPDQPVDKSKFMYPGPNPQSRETAVLMMADAVEAASRSLKEYTPKAINDLVDKIIDGQMADGMFNESPISFRDLQVIKNTFKKRLGTIYHSRVAYPELHRPKEEQGAPEGEKNSDFEVEKKTDFEVEKKTGSEGEEKKSE